MKAMILAAGLGTRLQPLTNYQPKALVKIKGMPLLEIVIQRLKQFGFNEIIINVHHFGPLIVEFLKRNKDFGIQITISDESELLLDTGGGLKKAAGFFEDGKPFLLYNTDILTNLDLGALYQAHIDSKSIATLAVRHRETSRYLLFDEQRVLNGWANVKSGEIKMSKSGAEKLQMLAFSGIHVIDPRFFEYMPTDNVFSIIDVYLKAARTENVSAFVHDDDLWVDAGKTASLEEAANLLPQMLSNM